MRRSLRPLRSVSLRRLSAAAPLCLALLAAGCDGGITGIDEEVLGCNRVDRISLGSTTSGTLSTSDCRLSDGAAVDYYRFRIRGGETVRVTITADRVDPYAVILDDQGFLVAEEDEGGAGFSELTAYLSSGTYYIAATSYRPGDYGSYRLRTERY